MSIPAFSAKENEIVGAYRIYPTTQALWAEFGMPVPDMEPKFYRPISPKENLKRVLDGKTPYWLPFGGMATADINCFAPRQIPDNVASHLVQDGEETPVPRDLLTNSAWFDLDWQFVPMAGGATVRPGSPKVEDMSEWEKYVQIPDIDSFDWDGMEKMNKEYLDTDKFNILHLLNGQWERLISIMDVDGAAMAMIDEDQRDGLVRFFDQYSTFWAKFIDRAAKICNIDCVLMHDDWGHQNGPFFSPAIARELLLPGLKKIIKACHDNGLYYEQHSCGQNADFIDLYIEAGVNLYCPQDINNFDLLLEKAKGSDLVIGVPIPMLPPDMAPELVFEAAQKWWDHYKGNRMVLQYLFPNFVFNGAIYNITREYYASLADIN